ncbi:hypothetical protein BACCIP111899_04186 [Bacillus rhizoplanae]|uniref:HNH endonuclease n=1 Tax=Bacillus rhizoplanae TaxID=2880966 RepID=A0ABM8YGJ4_9BACI|nr:hypothetical protein BACCIP111899_04186 [Bacillus rhizoplanae]
MRVLVMNLRGKFLIPCSPRKVWLLLKEGKVKIV